MKLALNSSRLINKLGFFKKGFIIEKKRIERKMKNKLEREKGKMRKLFLGLLENF